MDLSQRSGIDFKSACNFGTAYSTDFVQDMAGRHAYFDDLSKAEDELNDGKVIVEGLWMQLLGDAVMYQSCKDAVEGAQAVDAPLLHSQLSQKAEHEAGPGTGSEIMLKCAGEMLDHMAATHETFAITFTYVVYQLSLDPAMRHALRSWLQTLSP